MGELTQRETDRLQSMELPHKALELREIGLAAENHQKENRDLV